MRPRSAAVKPKSVPKQFQSGPERSDLSLHGSDGLFFFRPALTPDVETVHALRIVLDHAVEVCIQHKHHCGPYVSDIKLLRRFGGHRRLVMSGEQVSID